MAVPISTRRSRPRFGLEAGLVAAARGLALAGLMLAGLVLLAVIVTAVSFIALGAGLLIVGNGGPRDQHLLLFLVVFGAGLALGRFGAPAALLGIRRLASLTRRLAGEWCGVPIAEPRPRPLPREGRLSFAERMSWLLTDPGTWRDLLWLMVNLVAAWVLAALSAVIIGVGLIGFIGPELVHTIPPPAFPGNSAGTLIVLGIAISSAGVLAAPCCCAATACWLARCWRRLGRPRWRCGFSS